MLNIPELQKQKTKTKNNTTKNNKKTKKYLKKQKLQIIQKITKS